MSKIGLFYGPEGGNVDKVAKIVAEKITTKEVELHLVKETEAEKLNEYSNIIFGISTLGKHTWSSDNSGNDWDNFLPKLNTLDLKGKKVALFGLGDHIAYADFFVDSMGDLAEAIQPTGAEMIGQVSDEGYEFNESRAFVDGKFVGLPLDEDFESDLTEERVEKWLEAILPEFE
ncbi:flavodoxin [Marinifilum caeruleilacunae]|uniref:Flavodoxin n=1 Tax=Marinifilum caeruleilacunae TaxID=2499076 RepID=A0ABX1WTY4_9BACT|nr:flavodoxin [Marinifilum caeruleilacunae]NOU59563.1 flavodoxin [Marinifilum caeruleilacunae]